MTRTEAEIRRRLEGHRCEIERWRNGDRSKSQEDRADMIARLTAAIRTLEWVLRERE